MIAVDNVSMRFGSKVLFDEVTTAFLTGRRYGLTGPNGAGKSTFMKLLTGESIPQKGSVVRPKKLGVLRQDQFAYDRFRVIDTVIMGNARLWSAFEERELLYAKAEMTEDDGMRLGELEGIVGEEDGYTAESDAAILLQGLDIPDALHERKMGELQGGQKVRVLLAQALFGHPEALLLDEPTNHLDLDSIHWLRDFLVRYDGTLIAISHDRHFLNAVCTHIADIDYQTIITYTGGYDDMVVAKTQIRSRLESQNEQREKKIAQLNDFIARFSAGTRSSQVQSRRKEVERLQTTELARSNIQRPYIRFQMNRPSGRTALEFKGLSKAHGGRPIVSDFGALVSRGEKIVLVGRNGQGKTTLLKALLADAPGFPLSKVDKDAGTITWGHEVSIGYFPQDTTGVIEKGMTAVEWLHQFDPQASRQDIHGLLGQMLFSGEEGLKTTEALSGGETARLLFCRIMLQKPNVLILDEPTNHLDLEAINALNVALQKFEGTVLLVTHDQDLMEEVGTRVWRFDADGIRDFKGAYEEYKHHSPSPRCTDVPRRPPAFERFAKDDIEQSIPARFEQQVGRFPTRIAVDDRARPSSYSDLNRQSNRIAHAIRQRRGVARQPVILLLEQGTDLVAAILGVLKAGSPYVPLSPAQPTAQLAAIVAETGAALIVASGPTLAAAARLGSPSVRVLDVEAIPDDTSDQDLRLEIDPDAGAYIYYTSGSTGRPKGVVDTHRNVLHNVMRYTNSLQFSSDDRMTLLQSASFSGAVSSLFGALLNGATTCPFDVLLEGPSRIAPWLVDKAITIYHSVPSLFREVASSGLRFPNLRLIRLEGDRASMRDIEDFRTRFEPDCVLVNGLGATECGLVRQFFVSRDTPMVDGVVPIGYPVEDMDIVLIGEDGREAEPGDAGEIVVKSRYLAQGYWRRPDLTAAAFVDDLRAPGLRSYRTGDLGRLRDEGCLEHLGRKDGGVKVRGQWVALADVEDALQGEPGVAQAAVLSIATNSGEARLAAYVVAAGRAALTVSSLRRGLSRRLPAHMIPASFVFLDALPLSEHRKIDRRGLPLPGTERPVLDAPAVAARNLLELQIAQIWERVLGIGTVGVRDDFFDLGGDSLSAAAMVTGVEDAFGCSLSPSVLLERPTVEHLADHLTRGAQALGAPVVALRSGGDCTPLFFLHGDYLSGGFYCATLARGLAPEQPFYLLPPCGLDGEAVPASYADMATRHLDAMRSVQPAGPYRIGGLCNGGLVAYEVAQRLAAQGERVECLILIAAVAPSFELEWLRHFVRRAGRWAGRSEAWQLDRVARLRDMITAWRSLTLRGRAERGRQWFREAVMGLANGSRGRRESSQPPSPSLREAYRRIDVEYLPRAYPGRVVLLWPSEDPVPMERAHGWWQRVARQVESHAVPGTHMTCVTRHAAATAAVVARLLRGN